MLPGFKKSNQRMETLVGGLRAVELQFRGIREFETGETAFYQSRTRLNTPKLGTLMPENFRGVAEMSDQCMSLFELEITQMLEAAIKLREREIFYRWVSVYMPMRFLGSSGAEKWLMQMMDTAEMDTNRLCFELSPDILLEGNVSHSKAVTQLRNRGFHFMITQFGGTSSPLMKLSLFPVDFVMMSQEIIGYLGKSERAGLAVNSIVDFIAGMGATAIADGVSTVAQAEALYQSQCHFGAGSLAGRYVGERYIRRKKEE